MSKIIKSISVDEKVYSDYKLYASHLGRNVSSLLEEYMRNELNKIKKIQNKKEEK